MIEIYEHDNDGAHDLVTSFPSLTKNQKLKAEWEFQYVEDTDDIPTDEEAENGYTNPEYFFRVTMGGVSADSGLLKFKDFIEIEVVDFNEQKMNVDYTIRFSDGTEKSGSVDENGDIIITDAPPGPYKIDFNWED